MFSKIWLLRAESKELETLLQFNPFVIFSLCCYSNFPKFWVGSTNIISAVVIWYLIHSEASNWDLILTGVKEIDDFQLLVKATCILYFVDDSY